MEVKHIYRFKKGKYRNQEFKDVNDLQYMQWYYSAVEEHPELKKRIDELYMAVGPVFTKGKYRNKRYDEVDDVSYMKWYFDNVRASQSLYDRMEELLEVFSNKITKFEEMKVAFVTFHKNLNQDGEIVLPSGITLKFQNTKTYYYNDYPYKLPVLKGNSGTRIKGKEFKVWADPITDSTGKTIFLVKKMLKKC